MLPQFLNIKKNYELVRFGKDNDGGYLIEKNSILNSEILISVGISWDYSFEEDYLTKINKKVYCYDHTLNFRHYLPKISSIGLDEKGKLYKKENYPEHEQPVKPVTYSVIKHGIIGLTKYLATYWADRGVRCNAICPGGVYNNQPDEFVKKISNLIPLGRMATEDEYKASVAFLLSDASKYMNGTIIPIDGGRSIW